MTTEVKKYLRAAHRSDPEAFDKLIHEYMEHGPEIFARPHPGANAGAPKQLGRDNYALLYARVQHLRDQGLSETKALQKVANNADYWANRDTGYLGTIETVSTARKHYKESIRLYNEDESFRDRADFMHWAWGAIQ